MAGRRRVLTSLAVRGRLPSTLLAIARDSIRITHNGDDNFRHMDIFCDEDTDVIIRISVSEISKGK
jgi:hypothetical protein